MRAFLPVAIAVSALLIASTWFVPPAADAGRISPSLESSLSRVDDGTALTVWVFFRDRGLDRGSLDRELRRAEAGLNPRARWRRLARGNGVLVSERDLPLSEDYLRALTATGARIRARSRWLNAISIEATSPVIRSAAALPFVDRVNAVWTAPSRDRMRPAVARPVTTTIPSAEASRRGGVVPSALDYGLSYGQLQQIQVPALHEMGYTGAGVRVGMLDTGFHLTHPSVSPVNVLAQYDFIHGDSITADEPGQDVQYQDYHGTLTLSLIGGYVPGTMIGPAFDADFVLAKTEVLDYERPVEEDWWVEGIEWLESWGVDVVSSSLGYFNFEDPYPDYQYSDMDGDTAVTTIAADIAVSLGVVVCNCAGNNGDDAPRYTKLLAPADADSAMAIGAVNAAGEVTAYSSRGPSYDGRIKPDVCARGDIDVAADVSTGGYSADTGTSCSTPLAAGVCALLVQARPFWSPMELSNRLRGTADHRAHPDTLFGWGIIRPVNALSSGQSDVRVSGSPVPEGSLALQLFPNPSHGEANLVVTRGPAPAGAGSAPEMAPRAEITLHDVRGRLVWSGPMELPPATEARSLDVSEAIHGTLSPGVYLVRVTSEVGASQAKLLVLP